MPTAPRTFRPYKATYRKPWQKKADAPKRTLTGLTLQRVKREIGSRDQWLCQGCGCDVHYKNSILDHIQPISQGGTDQEDNLQTLCFTCSDAKTAREGQAGRRKRWRRD